MLDLAVLHRPTSSEEAVRLFHETEGSGLYLAGGTVLVPAGSSNLDFLVDLSDAGLDYIQCEGEDEGRRGFLRVGAATTVADVARSTELARLAGGILKEAALRIAAHTLRNRATVGGNIVAWRYPTDLPPVLLALGAVLVIEDTEGTRTVSLEDFYTRRRDVYRKGDLLVEVRVPLSTGEWSGAFEKLGRLKLDVAVVNCAAAVRRTGDRITEARVALNGVGPVPLRAAAVESALIDVLPSEERCADAAAHVVEEISPRSDQRASAEYRTKMARVLVERALRRACGLGAG